MDVLALASVITAGVAALSTGINAFYSTRRGAKTARETRINQRKAESYLEVLRLIELEAQWVEAWLTNRKIEAEEPIEGFEGRVPEPNKPPADGKAIIAAHLAAFGSKDVRQEYAAWRELMDAIDRERNSLAIYWREHRAPLPIDVERLKLFRDELLPAEAVVRTALAERSRGTSVTGKGAARFHPTGRSAERPRIRPCLACSPLLFSSPFCGSSSSPLFTSRHGRFTCSSSLPSSPLWPGR